jgi:arylsulfatase A-like enzyme
MSISRLIGIAVGAAVAPVRPAAHQNWMVRTIKTQKMMRFGAFWGAAHRRCGVVQHEKTISCCKRMQNVACAVVLAILAATSGVRAADARHPNIVLILADDMGFSDPGCFGGEIHTPSIDRLAKEGVRFSQFYNMARCCPTRAALLTGLYPHQAGIGAMNQDLGQPAYRGELNDRCVTIAQVLRDGGYHTGMAGKWHLCHLAISQGGPRARRMVNFEDEAPISQSKANWPCNRGFEEHWGTIAGVESYYDPYSLVHNEQTIRPQGKDFYYTDFITDHTVGLIDQFAADAKPFFIYAAYTAPHWPMQAREADIERYAHTYDVGWDKIREERYRRQVEMGLIRKEWNLSPRAAYRGMNDGASVLEAWDAAPDKAWQSRRMAVYAAMIECMDRGIGRILDELKAKRLDDNTLVIFLSDNGGCAENVRPDWYDVPSKTRDGRTVYVGNDASRMPGPQEVYQSYGPAWANASNTPFKRFKHWTEEGGISAPCIIRFPGLVKNPGGIETQQVGDVIDFMPTICEAAGASYPATDREHAILSPEGKSLLPVLRGESISRGPLCWEHEGNRAVRDGNWKLIAGFREPWQLYDMSADRTELDDVSSSHPEIVAKLKVEYAAWAKRCGVVDWPVRRG